MDPSILILVVQKGLNQSVACSSWYATNSNFLSQVCPVRSPHQSVNYLVQKSVATDSHYSIKLVLRYLLYILMSVIRSFCFHHS